jgi:hypothetical protein
MGSADETLALFHSQFREYPDQVGCVLRSIKCLASVNAPTSVILSQWDKRHGVDPARSREVVSLPEES